MKKVKINLTGKGFSNYQVKTEGNNIVVEVSDEQGFSDLWEFSKWLTDTNRIVGFSTADGENGTRFDLTMLQGFKGVIEGTFILGAFNATEELLK